MKIDSIVKTKLVYKTFHIISFCQWKLPSLEKNLHLEIFHVKANVQCIAACRHNVTYNGHQHPSTHPQLFSSSELSKMNVKIFYSLASKVSREVADLTEKKNLHIPVYSVKESRCANKQWLAWHGHMVTWSHYTTDLMSWSQCHPYPNQLSDAKSNVFRFKRWMIYGHSTS